MLGVLHESVGKSSVDLKNPQFGGTVVHVGEAAPKSFFMYVFVGKIYYWWPSTLSLEGKATPLLPIWKSCP